VVEFCKRVIEVRIAAMLAFRIVLSLPPTGRRIFQLRRGMILATSLVVLWVLNIPLVALSQIPPHGRWRHFDIDDEPRIQTLRQQWTSTSSLDSPSTPGVKEHCKRLLDLFLVSVLLDAGAGNQWTYHETGTDKSYGRSEGLAIASLDMFKVGFFSGLDDQPYRVDGA